MHKKSHRRFPVKTETADPLLTVEESAGVLRVSPHTLDKWTPLTCAACGQVVERKARQQKFCTERCRMRGRYLASKPENKSLSGLPCQNHSTTPPKNINDIKANSHGVFGPRCAVAAEVTNAHTWTPVTSSSGVASFVTTLRPPALREPTP